MKNLIIVLIAIGLSACSIFQSSTNEEEKQAEKVEKPEEVYVFDDVSEKKDKTEEIKQLEKEIDNTVVQNNDSEISDETIYEFKKQSQTVGNKYFLQLGAFSTLKRAEQYVGEITTQVPFNLSIIFNQNNAFYTVRSQPYNSREEVEIIREQFCAKNKFKDAFIITE